MYLKIHKVTDITGQLRTFLSAIPEYLSPNVLARHTVSLGACGILVSFLASCSVDKQREADGGTISQWVTTGDKSMLLKEYSGKLTFTDEHRDVAEIDIDPVQKFQTIDGFGFTLTGGSAMLLHKMPPSKRQAVLSNLFQGGVNGIGVSYLRISVGSSDLDESAFTYDDKSYGKKDEDFKKFSLKKSRRYLIPILKEIIALNPSIKIMASPWSAPAWMKTNDNLKGGQLNPSYYQTYADYLSEYIKAMQKEGIVIDALTLQNEPENPKNNPSMLMTAGEEAVFVKDNLGPAFKRDSVATKIVVFDHNCDHPEYPIAVLDDPAAKKYIDGSAFHLYLGKIEALTTVHKAHPDRNIYFTEQWTSGRGNFSEDLQWHTKNLIIGAMRNWSKTVLEWNLAADPFFNPHTTSGGCTECLGALTIGSTVTKNVSYYIIGQASKFVPAGSVRIGSSLPAGLDNVAFRTPDGKTVLIVLNEKDKKASFAIRYSGKSTEASLPPKSVGTFTW